MRKQSLSYGKQWLWGGTILLVSIILSMLTFLYFFVKPFRQARLEATEIAKSHLDISRLETFSIFNGEETYYSASGTTPSHQELLLLIPEAGGDILVFPTRDGVTAADAKSLVQKTYDKTAKKVVFGLYQDQPVWEVYADQSYYYIDFTSGELITKEEL